jgi:hypothetical protein
MLTFALLRQDWHPYLLSIEYASARYNGKLNERIRHHNRENPGRVKQKHAYDVAVVLALSSPANMSRTASKVVSL